MDPVALLFLALPFIWTLFNCVTLGMDIWELIDARADLAAKRRQGIDGVVEIVGVGNVRRAKIRLYVESVFIVVGVIAMLGTFGIGVVSPLISRLISTFGFVTIPIVMSYDRIRDRANRELIRRMNRATLMALATATPAEEGEE